MRTFLEIATEHGTDKVTEHAYHKVYPVYLETIRKRWRTIKECVVLFEIGVHRGASLRTWRDYIPCADVHGFDNDPMCIADYGERVTAHLINVRTPEFRVLAESLPRPDVVIDDGSHQYKDQAAAFATLWPRLEHGGVYFVEDLQVRRPKPFNDDLLDIAEGLMSGPGGEVESIHFYPEMCVLRKK